MALYANDHLNDADGDGLGGELETLLGTCDSFTQPGCANASRCPELNHPGADPGDTVPSSYAGIPSGSFNDALLARCLRDRDRDGVEDGVEVFGYNETHYPAFGADPTVKDIFAEVDWYDPPGGDVVPSPFSVDEPSKAAARAFALQIQAAFDPADGIGAPAHHAGFGYRMHLDIGVTCADPKTCGRWGGSWATPIEDSDASLAAGYRLPDRSAFRYAVASPTAGGQSGIGGMTLNYGPPTAVAPFVHEFGHVLGLGHFGHANWGPVNDKPHYRSIMNYAFDDSLTFSKGQNLEVLNPASMLEAGAYAGFGHDPSAYLDDLVAGGGNYWFKFGYNPVSKSADWNLDGTTTAARLRASPTFLRNAWNHHEADFAFYNRSRLETFGGAVGAEELQFARLNSLFYVFWREIDKVFYRIAPIGPADSHGSCTGINADILQADVLVGGQFNECLQWGAKYEATALGRVASFSVTAWENGPADQRIVFAYRGNYGGSPLVVGYHAPNPDGTIGAVTNGYVLGGALGPTAQPSVSIMYDDAAVAGADRVIAAFVPVVVGGERKYAWWTAPTSTSGFQSRGLVEMPGPPYSISAGDLRASIVPYPDHNTDGGLPTAGACGVFPNSAGVARAYCYNRADRVWESLGCFASTATGPCQSASLTRNPTVAFHHTRLESGLPLQVGRGALWIVAPVELDGSINWYFKPMVDTAAPWASSGVSIGPGSFEYGLVGTVGLFEDLRTSATKAAVGYIPRGMTVPVLEFAPFADGTFSAQLKDGNDFAVMEWFICRGIFQSDWPSVCGREYPGEF